MTITDIRSLEVILGQIRAIHDELADRHAGLAVLHMDAAMAALESHIRRLHVATDRAPTAQVSAGQNAHFTVSMNLSTRPCVRMDAGRPGKRA